ncbi:MAG: hypothetical protein AB1512_22980 [Thermodesulfobacteriota bacterium]
MSLLIGQAVTGRDVEKETSGWAPERFASMCDALAWAESGRRAHALPSFTNRVNARDGGIDAEWDVVIPEEQSTIPSPFVGPGWNVFQYKKRDLTPLHQRKSKIISDLKRSVHRAILEIHARFGKSPDRYVLFVNADLEHKEKEFRDAILEGCDPSAIRVEVVGSGLLAALLNGHPHLRAAFFTREHFKIWPEAYKTHQSHKVLGAAVEEIIGREEEKVRLQNLIQDKKVRIVVLTGPHDIGKTRLVLEATRNRPYDVVVALDPRSMGISDYMNLSSPQAEAICIVEDPDPVVLKELLPEMLAISNLKLIVTLPSTSFAPDLSYGRDRRMEVVMVEPLNDEASNKLLRKASDRPLDFGIQEWIIRQANGFPGIILAAASVGADLRRGPGDFLSKVGREFENRIKLDLGPNALKAARLFSILTHVGISGEWEDEISSICELFGDEYRTGEAIRDLEMLEDAGLARRAGSFGEISISLLGNYLAKQALLGYRNQMFLLYSRLTDSGRERFITRLSEIKGEEVSAFWDEFFSENGPMGAFHEALRRAGLLRILAGAAPERILQLFESGLLSASREERLSLAGDERREVMFALDQLLFRMATSRRALKLLWLLAEAENEGCGTDATGVLKECFHAGHEHMPLPLDERVRALKEFTSPGQSREGRIVAIEAAGEVLSLGPYLLREGTGGRPLDRRPASTYSQLDEYVREIIDLLMDLADDKDEQVSRAALEVLPDLISEYGVQGSANEAIKRIRLLSEWVLNGKEGLEVSRVFDTIYHMFNALSHRLESIGHLHVSAQDLERNLSALAEIRTRLENADYEVRLKRWAGAWSIEDSEGIKVDEREIPRYEVELERLAKEAAQKPGLLADRMISWLISDSDQKSQLFFYFLGKHDVIGSFRVSMEDVGRMTEGYVSFSAYWGGWASRDPEGAGTYIEALSLSGDYPAEPILRATSRTKATQTAVRRVIRLIEGGRISAFDASRFLSGPWSKDLDLGTFGDLLEAVAGTDLRGASGILLMLREYRTEDWTQDEKITEIAWRSLETGPVTGPYVMKWDLDTLAARLAGKDPGRGIKLLESLLRRRKSRDAWDPLEMHPRHRFWDVLHEQDKDSLFKALFDAGIRDPLREVRLTYRLNRLLDLEKDSDDLILWARKDERVAEIIARSLSIRKQGFWSMLEQLINLYPNNERIERYLLGAILLENEGVWGLLSEAHKETRELLETKIGDPTTSAEFRAFLRKVIENLSGIITHEVIWEYDIDIAGMRRKIVDKASPDRIWAIGRVLKYGGPEDWRKLLNVEDIEEALPQIDLPEQKRKIIERALPYWRNHV